MAKQDLAVLIQYKGQRHLLFCAFGGAVALFFCLPQNLPRLQRVRRPHAAPGRDIQQIIQHTVSIAHQRKGQCIPRKAGSQFIGARAHHHSKSAAVQLVVGFRIAACKSAGHRVAEVCHKHQHQRCLCRQQIAETVLRPIRRVVGKHGQFIARFDFCRHNILRPKMYAKNPDRGYPPGHSFRKKPRTAVCSQSKPTGMAGGCPANAFMLPSSAKGGRSAIPHLTRAPKI